MPSDETPRPTGEGWSWKASSDQPLRLLYWGDSPVQMQTTPLDGEVPLPKEPDWSWTFGGAQLGWTAEWRTSPAPKDREKGWKPDPASAGQLRHWDGENWTQNIYQFGMQELVEGWLKMSDNIRRASES